MGVAAYDVDSDIAADRRIVTAAELRDRVAALDCGLAVETHFAGATFPIVEDLHSLIDHLGKCPSEGAAAEILRRLRDTFLDGGWEQYRKPEARQAAVAVLDGLASMEMLDGRSVVEATEILELERGVHHRAMPRRRTCLGDPRTAVQAAESQGGPGDNRVVPA